MNKFIPKFFTVIVILSAAIIFTTSCKKTFDAPPAYSLPNVAANTTIKALKARHPLSGAFSSTVNSIIDPLNTDIIISGIVTADDRSGNFYKEIYIQDETGAISVKLDASSLYTKFPIGRRVYVKCNGLYISDYHGSVPQLGSLDLSVPYNVSLQGITASQIDQYVIGGTYNNAVTPINVTYAALNNNMQDTLLGALIKLNSFEVLARDTVLTYGDTSSYKNAINLTMKNCARDSFFIRSSGFANFAGYNPPTGNGSVVGIYTIYKSFAAATRFDKQLIIRDPSDLTLTGTRCTTSGGGGGGGGSTGSGNILSETFESQIVPAAAPYNNITITGWTNLAELGAKKFEARSFGTPINRYAQLSAFGTNAANVTSWLVTSAINLGTYTTKTLNFDSKAGYANGATLKVLVSTNFSGTGNPWDAAVTWTDITSSVTLSPGLATGYPPTFTPSGNVSLNAYTGTIYIAFKYEGADLTGTANDKTTTWQLDNIKVSGL
jgi:Family of unknown function (DUF5689)/Domain of unknown function (DUF5017)